MKLAPPPASGLPENGFAQCDTGFIDGGDGGAKNVAVAFRADSDRLAPLSPFSRLENSDYLDLPILLKTHGKCTTDHISPAGPWLKYRGHLDRISDNMFLAANNIFTQEPGTAHNVLTGQVEQVAQVARHYKAAGVAWAVIGDQNHGEGSSREHAAMSPRYLGCKVVLAKSFARIHESNLKQQGVLALTFANPDDYERIAKSDRVTVRGLNDLAPGKPVSVVICKHGTQTVQVSANHTMTEEQIAWFHAGSALNFVRNRRLAELQAQSGQSNPAPGKKTESEPAPEKTPHRRWWHKLWFWLEGFFPGSRR